MSVIRSQWLWGYHVYPQAVQTLPEDGEWPRAPRAAQTVFTCAPGMRAIVRKMTHVSLQSGTPPNPIPAVSVFHVREGVGVAISARWWARNNGTYTEVFPELQWEGMWVINEGESVTIGNNATYTVHSHGSGIYMPVES